MKRLHLLVGAAIFFAASCASQNVDVLNVGGFSGLGAATDVARHKGFLAAERIELNFDSVDSSEELMSKFVNGSYDLIQTNADNVIAWAEGQGMDATTHDFIIVMGGYRGRQPMELVVSRDITSVEDLQDKTLAVDALNTGYAPMLVYMLSQEDLVWKEDYALKSVGGGPMRTASMLKGDTDGGLVDLDDELKQAGFHSLLSSRDYITSYARGVTAARRDWAVRNEEVLVRYVRAMVPAINWLLNPDNRQEAITIIMAANDATADEARRSYEKAVSATFGFIPDAKIDVSGVEQIIKIRGVMGEMKPPLPPAEKYIDTRYYGEAIKSLTH